MNIVSISGRLTRDPELRTTNNGTEVCNFCIAVDRPYKRGEEKITDFFDCTAWRKTGVFVNQYFRKGDGINIAGRLVSEKWVDNDGDNRKTVIVTCESVEFPLGKSRNRDSSEPNSPTFTDIPDSEADDSIPF